MAQIQPSGASFGTGADPTVYDGLVKLTRVGNALVYNAALGDTDFRIAGDTEANLLYIGNDRVGFATAAPDSLAHFFFGDSTQAGLSTALIIEHPTAPRLQLLSDTAGVAGIFFSDDASSRGTITYDHGTDTMAFLGRTGGFTFANGGTETASLNGSGDLQIDGDFTPDGDITVANGQTITRGVYVESAPIDFNDSAPFTVATVDDGYAVTDVYLEVDTAFDGTAPSISVGDGGGAANFHSFPASAVNNPGYYGDDIAARGAYLWDGTSSQRKIYTGADTVDAVFIAVGATQGAGTIYTVIQKLK